MPDLTPDLLPRLYAHRLPELDFGIEFIHPYYEGGSILNIPATLCRLFDVPEIGAQSLISEIHSPLTELAQGVRRVVMVLVDALALHRMQRWMMDGTAPAMFDMLQDGLLAPLTSIVPCTTSTALPSMWSGLSPAQHGMVGYELWLKEYGLVANMIQHAPFAIPGSPGSLERAGFDPEKALRGPTLGTHLAANGIKPYAYQQVAIAKTGLSRMFLKDVYVQSFGTVSEMWINLRHLIEANPHETQFIGIYWGEIDRLSHVYGPDDERPRIEFAGFAASLEQNFIRRLSPGIRNETLLILVADHGQTTTPKDDFYDLKSHPDLTRRLPIKPTGENRLAYLYIRPGQTEAVREYLERAFMNQFVQLDPGYAIEKGLFGPGEPHPLLRERLGDLLVIPRGDMYLWWSADVNPIIGRHGGMSAEEMLVPFLTVRL